MNIPTEKIETILNGTETSRYMFLSRLIMDCKYYLGEGKRNAKNLWTKDEWEQLKLMRMIRDSFPEDKRPEWLTDRQLEHFEQEMLPLQEGGSCENCCRNQEMAGK